MVNSTCSNISLADPIKDTWIWNQDTGSWSISLPYNINHLSTQESNEWYATILSKTLDAFYDLARVWRVHFGPVENKVAYIVDFRWQQEDPYKEYISKVLKIIRDYPTKIFEIGLDVELFVYVHTQESPEKPVQEWVRLQHNEFFIHGGLSYLHFDIGYTLFGPGNRDYGPLTGPYPEPDEDFIYSLDDNKLQLLNQPLLEKALKQWEECIGHPISEVEGIPGIYKYGFIVEPY
jgi:hypothetical protein